jgi:hypothetical protein
LPEAELLVRLGNSAFKLVTCRKPLSEIQQAPRGVAELTIMRFLLPSGI